MSDDILGTRPELRRNSFYTQNGRASGSRACLDAMSLPQSYFYPNHSEGADSVHRDKKCPFSGVTSSGRVWRKVSESDARSVASSVTWTSVPSGHRRPRTPRPSQQLLAVWLATEAEVAELLEGFWTLSPQRTGRSLELWLGSYWVWFWVWVWVWVWVELAAWVELSVVSGCDPSWPWMWVGAGESLPIAFPCVFSARTVLSTPLEERGKTVHVKGFIASFSYGVDVVVFVVFNWVC